MNFKNRINKCMGLALTVLIVGGNISIVRADSTDTSSNTATIEQSAVQTKTGVKTSKIKNNIIMDEGNEDGKPFSRKALSDISFIEEKSGKTYVQLDFVWGVTEKSNIRILVNGTKVSYETLSEDLANGKKSVKFEVSTIEDKITVQSVVYVPGIFEFDSQYHVDLLESTLELISDTTPKPDPEPEVKPDPEPEPEVKPDPKPEITKGKLSSIENDIKCSDPTGQLFARDGLNKISYIEEVDGKTYVQMEFIKHLDKKSNVRVFVNGKSVSYKTISKELDKGKMTIKYEIPNLDAKTSIKCFVDVLGADAEYDILLKKDTLKFIKEITSSNDNNVPTNPGNGSGSGSGSTNTGSGSSGSNTNETIKGKLSSIKNKIICDDEVGGMFSRKQLSETTYIEEIDGKMYARFDFVSYLDAKSNIRIVVNGKQVSYQVLSKDLERGKMSIKFEIPNLDADIKVKCYVEAISMDTEYGVKLLKDTLKFEKDITASKLPQTGGVGTQLAGVLGTGLLGMGTVLVKKKED